MREFVGDLNLVEHDIVFNNFHMLFWGFNNINDMVEVGPVEFFMGNRFANWNSLLESFDEGNSLNDSTNGLLWRFILIGFL